MHILIIFSPMPPLHNGIADYTRQLLEFHIDYYRCIIVIDDAAPDPIDLPHNVIVMRNVEYRRHAPLLQHERHLFHIGNNGDHIYMLEYITRVQGIVVLHDPSIHHMMNEAIVGSPMWHDRLRDAAWKSQGLQGYLLTDQSIRYGWTSLLNHLMIDYRNCVLSNSIGAIVHSRYAQIAVGQTLPDLPCRLIPHFAEKPTLERSSRRSEARARLKIPMDEIILLSLGFVTNAKLIPEVLRQIEAIRESARRFRFYIVGEEHDISIKLEAEKAGVSDIIFHVGYIPEAELAFYLDASDILINLRYPTMGETSGSLSRALARGVCTFVSNHGSFADLPNDIVVKIPAVANPGNHLATALLAYISFEELRINIECAASLWAEKNLNLTTIATSYHNTIELFHSNGLSSKNNSHYPICCAITPSFAELRRRINLIPTDNLILDPSKFIGTFWWSEAYMPEVTAGHSLLVFGIDPLKDLVRQILSIKTTDFEPSNYGLFVSCLSELERSGIYLKAFSSLLTVNGIALINIWQDVLAFQDLSLEIIEDLLRVHDLEPVRSIAAPTKPLLALGMPAQPYSEVAILVRKRNNSVY